MVENPDQIVHFGDYLKVLRNRFWVIFTIFALTVLSGWYVTEYVLQQSYTAVAQIQIHSAGELTVRGIGEGLTEKGFDPTNFQAEFEIMQSPDVLLPIVNDLQLDRIWAKRVFKSTQEKVSAQEALGYLKGILKLDYKRGTNIIEITAQSEVPKEAADIANALADRYKTMRDVEEDQRNSRGGESLRDQIEQQRKVVEEKKAV